MSLEQTKIIDFIGIEQTTGNLILTISDHLDWSDNLQEPHIGILQDKLNTYLSYIESGQVLKDYPNAKNNKIVISIVGKFEPSNKGLHFFNMVRDTLEKAGYGFRFELL